QVPPAGRHPASGGALHPAEGSGMIHASVAERISALLMERFAGRGDCYLLEAKPARTVHEPLTREVVADHVLGRKRVGIFAAGTPWSLGFDCDGKNLAAGASGALAQARKGAAALDAALGLPPLVLELTRSGVGYRGLVFYDPDDRPTVEESKRFG